MRLFSTVIDGFSFDVVQLPNNPQFNELRIYGHRNQLIYSFMFQGTVVLENLLFMMLLSIKVELTSIIDLMLNVLFMDLVLYSYT